MSKYGPLKSYLQSQAAVEVPMSFAEIEAIIGRKLPASAYRHRPWWANEPSGHVHAQAWLEAGYASARVDLAGQTLVFRRLAEPQVWTKGKVRSGLSDAERRFAAKEDLMGNPEVPRHPMIGALKGTFTIAPDWDLTRPALDPDELADWEASLERKAELIQKGLAGRRS